MMRDKTATQATASTVHTITSGKKYGSGDNEDVDDDASDEPSLEIF